MAIQLDIYVSILNSTIGHVFSTADLKRNESGIAGRFQLGASTYSGNYLNSVLANRSVSKDGSIKGDSVKRGQSALFYRETKRGTYSLIGSIKLGHYAVPEEELSDDELPDDDDSEDQENEAACKQYSRTSQKCIDPAEIIYATVENTPYQMFFRKQRRLHPQPPAKGWEERLNSYFWPNMANNWKANVPKLSSFHHRFRRIKIPDKTQTGKAALLQLFRDICAWGGVKLPKVSASDLFPIVEKTLNDIDKDVIPKGSPLNSAWTKLYAIARPESFVIYDSRVATALVSILDPYMQKCAATSLFKPCSKLGYVNGRGGTRPRLLTWNWPDGYMNWNAQFAANNLCRVVVALLNSRSDKEGGWTLREVEAVLFMEGY